jgi:hypothetical protein
MTHQHPARGWQDASKFSGEYSQRSFDSSLGIGGKQFVVDAERATADETREPSFRKTALSKSGFANHRGFQQECR